MKQLRKANLEALIQIEELILSLKNQKQEPSLYVSSGVGPHVRHVLDHYLTFMKGLDSGYVDYNVRNRYCEIETDCEITLRLIEDIKHWLENSDQLVPKTLVITSEISSQSVENVSIESNVERELHYLAYHGIHHVAYCSLLAKQVGLNLDSVIGLAPGTASFLRSNPQRSV